MLELSNLNIVRHNAIDCLMLAVMPVKMEQVLKVSYSAAGNPLQISGVVC